MKTNNIKTLTIFFVFLTVACKTGTERKEYNFLTEAIEQAKIDTSYKWIVILPGMGCHGCIQEAEYFMKTNVDKKEILFILTNIYSLKILQQKTEVQLSDHPNIYIDSDNRFKIPSENIIYPCVIELKEGKIVKHTFQSPQTTAFQDMANQLK